MISLLEFLAIAGFLLSNHFRFVQGLLGTWKTSPQDGHCKSFRVWWWDANKCDLRCMRNDSKSLKVGDGEHWLHMSGRKPKGVWGVTADIACPSDSFEDSTFAVLARGGDKVSFWRLWCSWMGVAGWIPVKGNGGGGISCCQAEEWQNELCNKPANSKWCKWAWRMWDSSDAHLMPQKPQVSCSWCGELAPASGS